MSARLLASVTFVLIMGSAIVIIHDRTRHVTGRSSRLGNDGVFTEKTMDTGHDDVQKVAGNSESNAAAFPLVGKSETDERNSFQSFAGEDDFSLIMNNLNAALKEKVMERELVEARSARRRRSVDDAGSSQLTHLTVALKALESDNTQLKATVKELQGASRKFMAKAQEIETKSNLAISQQMTQAAAAHQQQQLALGQLQLQLSQLSTKTMKLQDENEALRAQMRLRMEDTDSRHERMQSMMLMISNLTAKLQAENSSIYSQLLKVSDLTSGLQAENDSIYLQLLKVSDLTTELQSENSSIYTQLLNVVDLMAGLQSDNSSIYSQLQALSADVIQRGAQHEEQHTALQEKVRMLQTQTTNLDSHLSKRSSALEERLTSHVTQLQQKDQELMQMVIRRTSVDLIGFHARLTDDVDAPNPKTLVLDRVEYNAGGGYDSTTGIFTAPVTGLYLFLATIGASSGDAAANVHIEVNGHARTGCFSKYSTNIELSTCHGADRVVKGQQVRIVTERDKRRIRGGWWTTFTVVLIQRED